MKLAQDPTTRARLRLLRPWLTPQQFATVARGLEEVEVPPRPSLLGRLRAAWRAGAAAFGGTAPDGKPSRP